MMSERPAPAATALARGSPATCSAAGVANATWKYWYWWNGCATRFTVR
ncbi:hypothetical protein [Pyxidicoccus xibeiensis]|nr:hypothetical protein [Pyxidicoccus xibeiensis]MCP3143243.1 hypothetical protein [Pyxidicoccus xibeiensis]